MNEREIPEYWDKRVREIDDLKKLVLDDVYFDTFEENTIKVLTPFKHLRALDVGCGYGRLSELFDNYVGVDTSVEMINLAKKLHPSKKFIHIPPGYTYTLTGEVDLIFEVMSLSSIGKTPEQFRDSCEASVVMCLEPKEFNIYFK